MTTLRLDFETASQADLKAIGAMAYACHFSTRVLCMAWAFDDEPVSVWYPGDPLSGRVVKHVMDGGKVSGWNVKFEYYVWNFALRRPANSPLAHLLPVMERGQLDDTMARAAYWGLPLSLDQAGAAMGLAIQKDKAGHRLMMKMCRPRTITPTVTWWHEDDPALLAQLGAYCAQDVRAERAIANALDPIPDREQRIWALDAAVNERGVSVDTTLIDRLETITKAAQRDLAAEIVRITNGQVRTPSQTKAMLEWLQSYGYPANDLKARTLREVIPTMLDGPAKDAAVIRMSAARASTAKLRAMRYASEGGRHAIYGMLQHYGANRTGRWAGRLVQMQNFPRPLIKNVDGAVLAALNPDTTPADLEMLFGADALAVVASSLRACIVAQSGHVLVSADLSQIEARVVCWLSGQADMLAVFADGKTDPYVYTANKIGSDNRHLGKVLVLACGFGMGFLKFQDTAKTYGLDLSIPEAEQAVTLWREANARTVWLWAACDEAAKRIARGEQGPIKVRHLTFRRKGRAMLMELPSGRSLCYPGIRIELDDKGREQITYLGVNQYTRKWERIKTYGGKLVENATQAVARDVMAENLLQMEAAGIQTVLTVHDEAIAETENEQDNPQKTLALMLDIMSKPPLWAPDLPVSAAGWIGKRYKKG